ncbi:unnamed protein product [Moneuplotes crassus]|uniref:Uncharacterized protein n=1 Tax=Euplotes crassus TaxID=5936 RepID=A0AAD1XH85_EUPCR|nr:unnamed protein product [Moneuplotes crassus]
MGSSQCCCVLRKIDTKPSVGLDIRDSYHSNGSCFTQAPLQLARDYEELVFYETLIAQAQRIFELYSELEGSDYPLRVFQINKVLGIVNEHMERSKWKYQGAYPDDYKIRYIDMGATVSTLLQECHQIISKSKENMLMPETPHGLGLSPEMAKKLKFEEDVLSESLKLDTDICTELYTKIVSGYINQGRNIDFIDLQSKDEGEYLKQSSTLTQAGSYNFFIDNVPALTRRSKLLLKDRFPAKTERFRFNGRNDNLLGISFYLKDITSVSHRVMKEVHICNFSINEIQLKKLLFAYRLIKEFMLKECKVMTPSVPDLDKALKGCAIEHLDFEFCGLPKLSDWDNNLHQFENLIYGLSKTDMISSLDRISVGCCNISEKYIKQRLDKYGFSRVKIQGFY